MARTRGKDLLFSEDWELFRQLAPSSKFYSEWGSGLSTLYVANQPNKSTVFSVETDPDWVKKVSEAKGLDIERIRFRYVDMGQVQGWGRPIGCSKIADVWKYSSAPFEQAHEPDLILIDGRFRVHCFLETLLRAQKGTRVIFDDYANRPWYHIVENFISPKHIIGGQSLFEVDTRLLDKWSIRRMSSKFSYVMDWIPTGLMPKVKRTILWLFELLPAQQPKESIKRVKDPA